jgi:hypothetical protein
VGGHLYAVLGRLDGWAGFSSWGDALGWLAEFRAPEPIEQIQFWGHGKWGRALIGDDVLDASSLRDPSPLAAPLSRIRERLAGSDSLWWFRTCETFGADTGLAFARAWTRFFGCRAAGHTPIIGVWQSGLHCLGPDEEPTWSAEEGLLAGTAAAPKRAIVSRPWLPRTITCFHGELPRERAAAAAIDTGASPR